jgi:hypothetical protein
MTLADELRAQARALYELAKADGLPDEGLLHVLHAIELETDAEELEAGTDGLERDEIHNAHVIDP